MRTPLDLWLDMGPAPGAPVDTGFQLSAGLASTAWQRSVVTPMADIPGGPGNDPLNGTGADDLIRGFDGNDTINGGGGKDTLQGGNGDDQFIAAGSAEIIEGGAGYDRLFYHLANAAVSVNLATGVVIGGSGNDTVSGIEAVFGTSFYDTLVGGSGNEDFFGQGGNDSIVGGDGSDAVGYSGTGSAVNVNLATGLSSGGAGNDTIAGVERVFGSSFNDTITGSAGDNTILGDLGNDRIDGGGGVDAAHYYEAGGAVTVNLQTGAVTGAAGNDTLTGIENVYASYYNDIVTGSDGANVVDAYFGNDTVSGLGGDDVLVGWGGADSLSGGDGADTLFGLLGNSGEDPNGQDGADTLRGGNGDDTIRGNAGNDSLFGDAGDDNLRGDAGNDSIDGGDGEDAASYRFDEIVLGAGVTFTAAAVNGGAVSLADGRGGTDQLNRVEYVLISGSNFGDTLVGSAGGDQITANGGNDSVFGGGGDDFNLEGGNGDDSVDGGEGNDSIYGAAGNDTFNGGNGIDLVGYDLATAAVSADLVLGTASDGQGGTDTLIAIEWLGGSLNFGDLLSGSSAANGLFGEGGNDTLVGLDGNDTLDGGSGADSLSGGKADDTYVVDDGGDVVSEAGNAGIDTVQASISWTLGANVENLSLTGGDVVNGTGNGLANRLVGNDAANKLNGAAGADTMQGGASNDVYYVDHAGDAVVEASGGGTDTVNSSITLALAAEVENLKLTGSVAINGTGNALANTLTGNAATNVLNGGAGNDKMIGGAGNDTYVVDRAGDKITENAAEGTDTVKASVTYTLAAEVENLRLIGSAAINGTGNALNNFLYGNAAANTFTGGAGNDRFVLDSLLASDTITDFTSGSDRLQLSMAAIAVGDGDTVVEGAIARNAPGGFATTAELVIMKPNIVGAIDAASAAAAIGSASGTYAIGQTALFMVDNGSDSALYHFRAVDADAAVEANELTLLVSLTGTAAATGSDFLFGA